MDSDKKRHERFLLDRFLELQGITPSNIVPRESPDFLVYLEGREVGIEVTEIFIRSGESEPHPSSGGAPLLQAVERMTNQIVSKARKAFFDAGNPPVLATIWFSDGIALDRKKGDQVADQIANEIEKSNLQDSQKFRWSSREAETDHPLSESVFLIHAQGVPERRFARWTVARPGLVAALPPKHLQDVIDKKAKKINEYKTIAEEIWLLIVADRARPSQMFSVTPDFPLDSISSPFTRTFLCSHVDREVIDLTKKVEAARVLF